MSGTRAISTTSRRELSSIFFLQVKSPKEIHTILTETLACFLSGRAKDFSAPFTSVLNFLSVLLGFSGFMHEFLTILINHTGILTGGLRTVFILFSCNRAAGPTKGSTGIIWLGPLGGLEGPSVNSYVRCTTKVEDANYFTVQRVCLPLVISKFYLRTNRTKTRDCWFCTAPEIKALKYSPNDGLCFTRITRFV